MNYFWRGTNYKKCDFMRYLRGEIYIYEIDYGHIYVNGYGYVYTGFENVEILHNEHAM